VTVYYYIVRNAKTGRVNIKATLIENLKRSFATWLCLAGIITLIACVINDVCGNPFHFHK